MSTDMSAKHHSFRYINFIYLPQSAWRRVPGSVLDLTTSKAASNMRLILRASFAMNALRHVRPAEGTRYGQDRTFGGASETGIEWNRYAIDSIANC